MKNACGGFYFVGCNTAQKKMQRPVPVGSEQRREDHSGHFVS